MPELLHIHLVSDGRKGHENQSCGLAEELAKMAPAQIHFRPLNPQKNFLHNARKILKNPENLPAPDLIICAGHHTHLPALALKWQTRAPLVVLMKPSLPLALFDLAIIPEHDLDGTKNHPKIIPSLGALNRICPAPHHTNTRRLILIGGPSKTHHWDAAGLKNALTELSKTKGLPWHLTDSRRTPPGFLDSLRDLPIVLHPHQKTPSDWLPHQLSLAAEVWVTSDSVSMIYEAVTAGAPVGILPLPCHRENRITRGLDTLIERRLVTPFSLWQKNQQLCAPAQTLHEAARCAQLVMEKLKLEA